MESMTRTDTELAKLTLHAQATAEVLASFPPDLEAPLTVDIPSYGTPDISWLMFSDGDGDGQRERAAAIVRALGGQWDKSEFTTEHFEFRSRRAVGDVAVNLRIIVDREQVCRRVVTGTHEETKLVPAPDAPTVTITETVEDVEWVCEPLLAEATA